MFACLTHDFCIPRVGSTVHPQYEFPASAHYRDVKLRLFSLLSGKV